MKNKINVVEVTSDTNIGGAGKCVLTYLRYYDKSKYNMFVVVPKGSLLIDELKKTTAKVIEVDGIADKSLDINAIKKLKAIFKSVNAHIVHTHASMSARIAAKQLKIKVVYTRHSVFEPSRRISQGMGKKFNGFINNHYSDTIIAVAEAAKDNLTQTGVSEKKISVVLNGVEPLLPMENGEISKVRQQYGITDDDFLCAIVARVTAVKGHRDLIEAFKILKDKGYDKIKLIIAGTGDELEALKQMVKAFSMENMVIFAGFLKDVKPLMNAMDLQMNASFGTEATSLSLLEGMSLGKPAVVSDFGGNTGVIENGKNGYVFPTRNVEKMAELVEKIYLDKNLYASLSKKSKEVFNKKFKAEIMTKNIEKIYDMLIK